MNDRQEKRRRQIEAAAFEVLAERGYRRTSMLQIAKKASASNQTLYSWYDNKQSLFQSIIRGNAESVSQLLRNSLKDNEDPLQTLKDLGPLLLQFTTGPKAIIMNRAAIADAVETGLLGQTIEKEARSPIYSLICSLMEQLGETGQFEFDISAEDAADTYISLLFGEVQMRQALGNLAPLDDSTIQQRAVRAFALSCQLYSKSQ